MLPSGWWGYNQLIPPKGAGCRRRAHREAAQPGTAVLRGCRHTRGRVCYITAGDGCATSQPRAGVLHHSRGRLCYMDRSELENGDRHRGGIGSPVQNRFAPRSQSPFSVNLAQ